MQSRARSIAVIYNATRVYDLKVMSGVAAYLQENERFSVYLEENALKDQRLPDLHSWSGDGIIANLDDPDVASAVVKTHLPVVGFGSGYGWYGQNSSIPYFFTNNQAVAKLAAEHLLERGFRNFAYCGIPKSPVSGWSTERQTAFADYLSKRGFECHTYGGRHTTPRQWNEMQRWLGDWLLSLPKPVGVMAANDSRARHVLEACRGVRLRVPEEVAVIGVDNHELLCRLSSPALSSIEQGARRIGYEAAKLLDRMMSGKKPTKRRMVIGPKGVVTRQSTDFMAIDDALVAKAMAYVQEHAADGIKVPDVVHAVAVSRSGLETRFRDAVGYTIHQAIRRVQLEKTRRLIAETSMPLKQIADNMGFKSVQHMTHLFGKAHGCSPARYRHEASV